MVLGHVTGCSAWPTQTDLEMTAYLQTWCPGDACDPCEIPACANAPLHSGYTGTANPQTWLLSSAIDPSLLASLCDPVIHIHFASTLSVEWNLTGTSTVIATLYIEYPPGTRVETHTETLTGTMSGPFWVANLTLPYPGGVFEHMGAPTISALNAEVMAIGYEISQPGQVSMIYDHPPLYYF